MIQVIGQFEAIDMNSISIMVIVSQESFTNEHGETSHYKKIFSIGDENGEQLIKTENPKIFNTRDGRRVKKIGPIITKGV